MDTQHDREHIGGEHLLVVVVKKTVSRSDGKAVANLRRKTYMLSLSSDMKTPSGSGFRLL